MTNNTASSEASPNLAQELKAAQDQARAWQIVANEAATNLVLIESKFAPILGKKFNFFNALLHLQMYVELIKEVIELIRNFKAKYVNKDAAADN